MKIIFVKDEYFAFKMGIKDRIGFFDSPSFLLEPFKVFFKCQASFSSHLASKNAFERIRNISHLLFWKGGSNLNKSILLLSATAHTHLGFFIWDNDRVLINWKLQSANPDCHFYTSLRYWSNILEINSKWSNDRLMLNLLEAGWLKGRSSYQLISAGESLFGERALIDRPSLRFGSTQK